MSFKSSEFAWNSVDVRGDDGLLHSGRVIDVLDEGLVVHFGGTGHSGPKLMPFSHVYVRWYTDELEYERVTGRQKSPADPQTMEVLLRLQPEDPWKWYPAILLDPFGLVSVSLPDRELKGFVAEERIRKRASEKDLPKLLADKARFSRREVIVPREAGAVILTDNELIAIFNAHCRQHHYWMMASHVRSNPQHGLFNELSVLGFFNGEVYRPQPGGIRKECQNSLTDLLLFLLNKGADITERGNFLASAAPCPDGDIQSLYRDPTIFPQILECFTTLQQTKRRGVCKKWDAILTSGCFRRVLTVSQPRWGRNYTRNICRFASCLYHCWTKQTKLLVFYGGRNPGACKGVRLLETARLLQRIRAEKGLPAAEMLLLTREWNFSNTSAANWVSDLWKVFMSLADVCRQVVLKDIGVNVELDSYRIKAVRFSDQRMTCQLTVNDFTTLLNNGLRDLDDEYMESLSKWGNCEAFLRKTQM